MRYDAYDENGTKIAAGITAERAAELAWLDPEDVEWAVEGHGRCDTPGITIVAEGESYPGPYTE